MTPRRMIMTGLILMAAACSDPVLDPAAPGLSLHRSGHDEHRTIIVDPRGRHDATTIQAGIDMAPAGGRVSVMPGAYAESLLITKGLTLEGVEHRRERVVIATPGAPAVAVQVATPDPVSIRDLTLHFTGTNGIRGVGVVDVTVQGVTILAVNAPLGLSSLVSAANEAPTSGRANLVVRETFLDGAVMFANSPSPPFPQSFGILASGDVDAVLERNVIRRMGGACIFVRMRNDFGGRVDANIVGNDLDECYPFGRAAAILVSPLGSAPLTEPIAATGTVNIIGNTIRNTTGSCLTTTAIHYEFFAGRIEHNSIEGVVQPCATATTSGTRIPSAILVGSYRVAIGNTAPLAAPVVRFNNIAGNAQAGLRVTPRQTTTLDARCNYWGAESGPAISGGSGAGDSIVVEVGAARPVFTPFATDSIAERRRHHSDHHKHHDNGNRESCRLDFSLWSEPVNLGALINSTGSEQTPTLSTDGLSLYFQSNRAGSAGADLWVSQRASRHAPWESPVNLGPLINSAGSEGGPSLSSDGHLLFFHSDRPGGQGGNDIYVSHRENTNDDVDWGPPTNLGPDVNTAGFDGGAEYWGHPHHNSATLFFGRGATGTTQDIYSVPLSRAGQALGPASPVPELNTALQDAGASVRADGLELVLFSTRPGGLGGNDLWVSTRTRTHDAWSLPWNLGAPINSDVGDQQANVSDDGRTLVFASSRPGGSGSTDIWMSTRTHIRSHD